MNQVTKKRIAAPGQTLAPLVRKYTDIVPEDKKEKISKKWGEGKNETLGAAKKHGMKTTQGESFNKVITFSLDKGYYHIISGMTSTRDISPDYCDIGALCSGLIDQMAATERKNGCTPRVAINVCDWDSGYATKVGANDVLRNSVIDACIRNYLLLPGGETANLGHQVRKKGMSWMFTLLSKSNGLDSNGLNAACLDDLLDSQLRSTFAYLPNNKYEIVTVNGIPFLHVKKAAEFVMTADGTGSKSIIDGYMGLDGADIYDATEAASYDAVRDGAYPLLASIGVHAETSKKKAQMIKYMKKAGEELYLPFIGSVFHDSDDVNAYIMNCVTLSEVKDAHIKKNVVPGLDMVLLGELQRTNGITFQWTQLGETFGDKWYLLSASDALDILNRESHGRYSEIKLTEGEKTLGELVARHSTPYFRIDSNMPEKLNKKINLRINVSSGGIIGKTQRGLEPYGVGADYYDVFEAPDLTLLIQMASHVKGTKGIIPDDVANGTGGNGTGAVVVTEEPDLIKEYYEENGIRAKIGGIITPNPEINMLSKCLDAILSGKDCYKITHKYTDPPLG